VIQVDAGARVAAVDVVEVEDDEAGVRSGAPLRRQAAGHFVSAAVNTGVASRVLSEQYGHVGRHVRIVRPT